MSKNFGFTMAEILLSLTIIGVIAAITLPSLTGNINERTWNTQRKALYARFSQALALMPSLNGYGTFSAEQTDSSGSITQGAVDTTTETFIADGLSKVLKINNICDSDHLADCGIASTIHTVNDETISNFTTDFNTIGTFNSQLVSAHAGFADHNGPDTKAAAFETQNGESIVVYYNPNCVSDRQEKGEHFSQPKMCVNFVYDLNGNKGPNTVGKDIGFITAFYPTDPTIVAPVPLATKAGGVSSSTPASQLCQQQDSESRLPNKDELTAMYVNKRLLSLTSTTDSLASATKEANKTWIVAFINGTRTPTTNLTNHVIWCIKR